MKKTGIYKIENITNGKVYIGQSVNIAKRWSAHRHHAFDDRDEKTYNLYLYTAIRKYGLANFSFSIIEECPEQKLDEREKYWISYYKANLKEYGYNLSDGGDTKYSSVLTSESNISQRKTKISEIKSLLKTTDIPIKEIATLFGMTKESITNINRGNSWKTEDEKYPIRDTRKKTYYYCPQCGKMLSAKYSKLCKKCDSERQSKQRGHFVSKELLEEDLNNYGITELSKKYNVTPQTICRWVKKYGLQFKGWHQERRLKFEQI